MKILVTGSHGFIGAQLIHYLSENYKQSEIEIYAIDDLRSGYEIRLAEVINNPSFNHIKTNVVNLTRLELPKMDWVIHCSATAPLPDNQISHYQSLENNVSACGAIADFCIKTGTRNIIFMSSSAIYEKNTSLPFYEHEVSKPSLLYPMGKYLAEQYFESLMKSYDMNVFALRLANVYGPRQDYFRKQPPLIGYLIKSLIKGEKATLYANGNFGRDYVFIDDLTRLINIILNTSNPKGIIVKYGHDYNVGSNTQISVPEIIECLQKVTGQKLEYEFKPTKDFWHKYKSLYEMPIKLNPELIEQEVQKKTKLDSSKCEKAFGWFAETTFEEGLLECFSYGQKLYSLGNL